MADKPAFVGTATSGVISSGARLAANLKPDIDAIMRKLYPYQTPITNWLFFQNKKVRTVTDKRGLHTWFEKSLFPHYTTVKAAITGGATITLSATNVDSKAIFKVGDMVFFDSTLELGYVSAIPSDVTVTPLANASGAITTFTNIPSDGSQVRIIGSAQIEGNSTPNNMWVKEVQKNTYCQIFTESVKTTGRDQAGQTYTNDTTHDELVADKLMELKFQIERAFIYNGVASYTGTGTDYRSYTQGAFGTFKAGTNATAYTGALTEDAWNAYLSDVFLQGTGSKIHYCGPAQANDLTAILYKKVNLMQPTGTKYGWVMMDYIHTQGTVKVVYNPVMEGKFSNWGYTLDVDQFEGLAMANDKKGARKLRVEPNVQTPGTDQLETKILSDVGFKIMNESKGGVLYKA